VFGGGDVGDWVLLRLDPWPAYWAQFLPGDLGPDLDHLAGELLRLPGRT
jgi:hypothetical protein